MQKEDLQLRFTSVCLLRFYLRGFIGAGARAEWSAGVGGWVRADHKGSDSGLQNFHNLRINLLIFANQSNH